MTYLFCSNALFFYSGTMYLQIIPSRTNSEPANMQAYLISAIVALVGTISFLFIYSKSLNKIIKSTSEQHARQLQDVYKEEIKDYKEITAKNTEAFRLTANATNELTISNKENTKAMHDLRIWLVENLGLKK